MKFKSIEMIGKALNKIITLLSIKIKDFNSRIKVLLFNYSILNKIS